MVKAIQTMLPNFHKTFMKFALTIFLFTNIISGAVIAKAIPVLHRMGRGNIIEQASAREIKWYLKILIFQILLSQASQHLSRTFLKTTLINARQIIPHA
jgi:hypothetical protein